MADLNQFLGGGSFKGFNLTTFVYKDGGVDVSWGAGTVGYWFTIDRVTIANQPYIKINGQSFITNFDSFHFLPISHLDQFNTGNAKGYIMLVEEA